MGLEAPLQGLDAKQGLFTLHRTIHSILMTLCQGVGLCAVSAPTVVELHPVVCPRTSELSLNS